MSADFKKIAAAEIEEFKAEYRARFPGRDADDLTDEDLLREVMNTVGKAGKLGEHVRCVVSRLDADRGLGRQHRHAHPRRARLRHAAAVRAGGRPRPAAHELRRRTTTAVSSPSTPRSTACRSRSSRRPARPPTPQPGPAAHPRARPRGPHRLRDHLPAADRATATTSPTERLTATFTDDSQLALSTADVPTSTENAPIVGESSHPHARRPAQRARANEVAFLLAKLTLEKYFRDDDGNDQSVALPAAAGASPSAGWPSASRCKDEHLPAAAAARPSSRTTRPTASTSAIVAAHDGDGRR